MARRSGSRAKSTTATATSMASPTVEHMRPARAHSEAMASCARDGPGSGRSTSKMAPRPKATEPTKPTWKAQPRSSAPAPRNPSNATADAATQGPTKLRRHTRHRRCMTMTVVTRRANR